MDDRAITKPSITEGLLWKDCKTLQSLVVAIWIGILLINLVSYLFMVWHDANDLGPYIGLWLLMPNLVALGAPAMLVGNEEESGTLDWLRTLPVSWKRVIDSKFAVALAAFLATFVFASIVLVIPYLSIRDDISPMADDLLRPIGIAKTLLFSVTLLLLGFVAAYTFRSPIAALIALVPLIIIVHQGLYLVCGWILMGRFTTVFTVGISTWRWVLVGVVVIAFLAALWFLQRAMGKRRMVAAARVRPLSLGLESVDAYRPPMAIGLKKPGKIVALLWQQSRQVALPASALTVIALFFLGVLYQGDPWNRSAVIDFVFDIALPCILLTSSWIGCLVFYGDSVRRRCNFFADRGISPTRIWWTRILLPGFCCLLLAAFAFALPKDGRNPQITNQIWTFVIVAFAFGQLVAQWVARPVLAFFAAPAFMMFGSFLLFFAYWFYPEHQWTYVLVVPVLLFTTWRMCGRWLEARLGLGFHWRVVAYSALSILIPLTVIVVDRVSSTPALRPEWRATAMEVSNQYVSDQMTQGSRGSGITADGISTGAHWPHHTADTNITFFAFENLGNHPEFAQSLKEELGSDTIGEAMSVNDIESVLQAGASSRKFRELKRDAIRVLLRWSKLIRERVVDGKLSLFLLERIAEPAETFAVRFLHERSSELGNAEEIAALVAAIPSEQLRFESRKIALLREWRRYQSEDWEKGSEGHVYYQKFFKAYSLGDDVGFLSFERRRSDRFVDEATRLTWDQLEQGLPAINSAGQLGRRLLWDNIFSPRLTQQYLDEAYSLVGTFWTSDHENAVRELRARYAGGQTEE